MEWDIHGSGFVLSVPHPKMGRGTQPKLVPNDLKPSRSPKNPCYNSKSPATPKNRVFDSATGARRSNQVFPARRVPIKG